MVEVQCMPFGLIAGGSGFPAAISIVDKAFARGWKAAPPSVDLVLSL
jgi:hypothetical protein